MTALKKEDEAAVKTKPHYAGHRQRLRERLLESGADALQDYELLEILLFAGIPQRDVKPLAKDLLNRFKTLKGVIHASREALDEFGLGDAAIAIFNTIAATHIRISRDEVLDQPVLNNWQKILDYCYAAMAHETIEQLRIIFLNRKNRVIADEVMQKGTIDHTPVYTREVVKRALELGAGAIILVHNHPSGDPTPSKDDIVMTKAIADALKTVSIVLHDHLIIGKGHHTSFKESGLL